MAIPLAVMKALSRNVQLPFGIRDEPGDVKAKQTNNEDLPKQLSHFVNKHIMLKTKYGLKMCKKSENARDPH